MKEEYQLRKRYIFSLVMASLIIISLLAACTPTTTTTTPATQPATTTKTEAPKVIELNVNDHNPPGSGPAKSVQYWADQVNEQSNGRLQLNVVPGAALFTGDEIFRAVQTKAVPMGMYAMDAREGFHLNIVTALPFLGWKTPHFESAYYELLNQFPEMREEWDGVEILGIFMMPGTNIANTKRAVKTPADLKGLKMMGAEQMLNAVMETAGATPVQLDITEMATSLNSKLIDGIMNHFNVMMIFGALEMMDYPTVFGNGINSTPTYLIGNTEMINELPEDLQKILRGNDETWRNKFIEESDAESAAARAIVDSKNVSVLTDAEIKVWYDMVKGPVHDKWIQEGEAKGLPAQAVYDACLKLVETTK
jgi:TRAP-type C4-dicarboxylate transport system substrate-binding protein